MAARRTQKRADAGAVLRDIAAKMGLSNRALGEMLGYSPRQMNRLTRHATGRATRKMRQAIEVLAARDAVAAARLVEAFGLSLDAVPSLAPRPAGPPPPPPMVAVAAAVRDALRALGDALVLLAESRAAS